MHQSLCMHATNQVPVCTLHSAMHCNVNVMFQTVGISVLVSKAAFADNSTLHHTLRLTPAYL